MAVYVLTSAHTQSSLMSILQYLQENDDSTLSRVLDIIKHVHDTGWAPKPPFAKPLRWNHDWLCEIRAQYDRDTLLRIYYFVHRDASGYRLILLNCITKPDWEEFPAYYEGAKWKRLRREIEESIAIASEFKKNYHSQNHHYEPLF